jgi:predicted O-linked N-acetylglucosamine transferase (SPINDLY family)
MSDFEAAKALFFEGLDLLAREALPQAEAKFLAALRLLPERASILTNLAVTEARLGKLGPAREHARQAVAQDRACAEGWFNLAQIEMQCADPAAALAACRCALALDPANGGGWALLAACHDRGGELREAVAAYRKALQAEPDRFEWLANLGAILNELREFDAALDCHRQALRLRPQEPGLWSNCGNALHELRRHDEALEAHDKALALDPGYARGWSNRASTLHALGRFEEALESHRRALDLDPDYAEGWSNRGNTLRSLRRPDAALAAYERALALKPDYALGWSNKAAVLRDRRRHAEALQHCERALQLDPGLAEAWLQRGLVYYDQRLYAQALEQFEQALRLRADYAEAWADKGVALHELNRHEEALAAFGRALALEPEMDYQLGQWLHARMKLCDWEGLDRQRRRLFDAVLAGRRVSAPFQVLALSESERINRLAAEMWTRDRYPPGPQAAFASPREDGRRVRIGYFSADFHNHAAAYLTAELFERHDRNRFEILAFSFGPEREDAMRLRLRKAFDRFIDVRATDDAAVAAQARALGLDIAVDLKGHTEDSRLGIFAHRAAPIQATYLGYPGTTGAGYIDYLIADAIVIPVQRRGEFSEQVVYLPHCYQVNDSTRRPAAQPVSRAALGLPRQGVVFCCFNNHYKITPETFACWMRVLAAVPDSVLWLAEDNAAACRNLRAAAARAGVAAQRLVFAPRIDYPQHLARQRAADLFLDTWPYNAHTTASDALIAGLPVLTRIGTTFPGRVAASLLTAAGLPELVTPTAAAYEELAIALARDPERLAALREKLEAGLAAAPLFDTAGTTRALEAAYLEMLKRYRCGLPPRHFALPDLPAAARQPRIP